MNGRSREAYTSIVKTTDMPMAQVPRDGAQTEWVRWLEDQPHSKLIGMRCTHIEPGRIEVRIDESSWPLNPNGGVHGGLVLAWADHCFGLVAMTVAAPGQLPATATLTAEFLRPALPPLTYEARVNRFGRTLAFITVEVLNTHGVLCAKVSGTMSTDGSSRFLGREDEDASTSGSR